MSNRPVALFSVLSLMAFQGKPGPASPVHYRFDATNVSTSDFTKLGAGVTENRSITFALLTLTTRDTVKGQIAELVIDSIAHFDGGAMTSATATLGDSMTSSGKGVVFRVFLVDGKVRDYSSSKPDNLESAAVSEALAILFPGKTSKVKIGAIWTDTTLSPGAKGQPDNSEIAQWTWSTRDTLNAVVSYRTSRDLGKELGVMTTRGNGTRRAILDASGMIREARSTISSSAALSDAQIKGTNTVVLTRVP